ncbi:MULTISPECIES: hypothetical protein [unclassified Clostridium]|uniref:hypothetical protein n=1 Tax=unclassified Clostridium TaxID=2614128 RepID=UPI000298374C|nr:MULTISPECIES: hypothetical protein [unclassified Clostridium]EKQ51450.1 MAG: hypothetical protein A370_04890 [Clostridium sp. Maddingley MBC34-26]
MVEKHLDEVFLEKKKEYELLEFLKEKKKYDEKLHEYIRAGSAKIGENEAEFHYEEFFNSLRLAIPDELKPNGIDSFNKVFSSESKDLNIILTCAKSSPKEITLKEYKDGLAEKMIKNFGVPIKWVEEGIKIKDNYKITYVSFLNPVDDIKSYNFIFYLEVNCSTIIINFNCMGDRINDWDSVGKGIMECLEIVNNEREGE